MDIAIDIRSLIEGRFSGVEQYTTRIIERLLRLAPHHTYHLFYNAAKEVSLPSFPAHAVIRGFRFPNKLFNASQAITSLPRWDSLVPADVFFIPNSRLVPLSPHVPLVVVAHDLSFERFPEFLDVKRRMWHRFMNPEHLMKRANHVIAVSHHTKKDVQRLYGLPEQDISIVYSGVELPAGSSIEKVKITYALPEQFVLYIGTLEPRKNIASLVKAFDAIASYVPQDLVIAGEKGWKESDLLKAYENAHHKDRIHMIGFIPEADKAALYKAADLFVYPSFYEGFGFPALEALVSGTPVVTSFNSSLPEVVGKWATLIDPYNPGELALVMKELLLDLPRVDEHTIQEIQETYSWDKTAQQTLEILEKTATE